ncbi:nicotinamide riboside transporter PnuC [Niabella digestorum]|jgi:nicotinamide mononucleotide transporter PnuC|uniref:Nicotinamide riboside transporter PnuC n=1 Tax=Niabella digestorum TaxID=3117701 RepID=A0ABU7RGV3_9BACT
MSIQHWISLFWEQLKAVPLLEWIGVSFGVAEVLLAKANKVWLYPCGIIAVLISIYIFFHAGLYAESALHVYYFVMSVYGWWRWQKGNNALTHITRANRSDWLVTTGIVVVAFFVLYFVLIQFTDSTVPIFDSWVSATAWAGMWLLAKRKIENWILLNISNAFAIPLLIYKELPLYALLTLFLFIVAILGYRDWSRILKKQKQVHEFSFE